MTKIVPNDLLQPTEKTIKNWNCSFIAVEGPNIADKLSLEDLEIPYESQYRARIILKAGETDVPLLYGFIGKAVTFLMVKVTYDSVNDPYYKYEQENYNITYYLENDPVLRPLGRLMILTGSAQEKIPQVYLNNPVGYDVVLDVLHATVDTEYSGNTSAGLGLGDLSDVILSGLTSGSSGSSGTNGTSGSSGITPQSATAAIRLFVTAVRSNSSAFYFNSVTRLADSVPSPSYDSAFMVTVSNLTTVKVYLRQSGNVTNSTQVQIWRSSNSQDFSAAITGSTISTQTVSQHTITLFTFSGLTINQYDCLYIYCKPTSGGSTYYGIVTVE